MGLEEGPRPYFRVVKGGSRGGVVNFIVRNTGRLGEEGRGGGLPDELEQKQKFS